MIRFLFCLLVTLAPVGFTAQAAPQTRAEATAMNEAFLRGLSALNAGRPDIAIPILRRILARHPGLIRVRLELARAYFADRQWRDARREFERALSADLPDAVRQNVLVFIRRIDARRGFDWQLDLAVAELGGEQSFDSDTVDLVFQGVTLPFSIERDKDREIGLRYDVSARASTLVDTLSSRNASTTLFVQPFAFGEYARIESLRDENYGLRTGAQIATRQSTFSGALVSTRRDLAARRYETPTGVEFAADRRNATGLSVFGVAAWLDIDNHVSDALDGDSVTASLGLRRTIGGVAGIGVSVFGERRRADAFFEEYDRYGMTLFGSVEPGLGLTFDGSVFTARRDFPAPNPLFADNPDEIEYGATIRVAKTDLFIATRFTPYVEVSARRVDSGISAFSYDEQSLSVGVEKAF